MYHSYVFVYACVLHPVDLLFFSMLFFSFALNLLSVSLLFSNYYIHWTNQVVYWCVRIFSNFRLYRQLLDAITLLLRNINRGENIRYSVNVCFLNVTVSFYVYLDLYEQSLKLMWKGDFFLFTFAAVAVSGSPSVLFSEFCLHARARVCVYVFF